MKQLIFVVLIMLIAKLLFAEEMTIPENAESKNGMNSSQELTFLASTYPEVLFMYTKRFCFPFLQGESPLTEENNIEFSLTAEVTPISLNGYAEAIWTPIAFLQVAAGGRIGSAWNMTLGDFELNGIGINYSGADGKAKTDGSAFDGLLWKIQAGAAFQMDAAAIIPGDWNHIVLRSYHEINYRGYSKAKEDESWYYQCDDGENQNGFNYYGNILLGYQMPIFLNTIAFMAEMDLYLYDTPNGEDWGDDMIRWTFSNVLQFTINEKFSASLITQLETSRNYKESHWEDLYYRNRHIDTSNPLSLVFKRVVASVTYTF